MKNQTKYINRILRQQNDTICPTRFERWIKEYLRRIKKVSLQKHDFIVFYKVFSIPKYVVVGGLRFLITNQPRLLVFFNSGCFYSIGLRNFKKFCRTKTIYE